MKILLGLFVAISISFMACEQSHLPDPATIEFSKATFIESGSSDTKKTMVITITNTSSTKSNIHWEFTRDQGVSGWGYHISQNGMVPSTSPDGAENIGGAGGSFLVYGKESITIEVTVYPNNHIGTGSASIAFSNDSQHLTTATYNYTFTSASPLFSLSKYTDAGTSPATTTDVHYKTVVTNLTNQNLEVTWSKSIASTSPANWVYATITGTFCWAPYIETQQYTISPNDYFDLEAVFRVQNIMGTGEVTHSVYLASDSANTVQSFVVTHTAN